MKADDRMFIFGGTARILYFHRRVDYFRFKHLVEKYAEYVAKRHGWPVDPMLRLMCLPSAAILLKNPMHPDWKKWRYEN